MLPIVGALLISLAVTGASLATVSPPPVDLFKTKVVYVYVCAPKDQSRLVQEPLQGKMVTVTYYRKPSAPKSGSKSKARR